LVRRLLNGEIADLLAYDSVARLATLDADGYPHVTPLWFVWNDATFYLASDAGRPHLARIRSNPKVGLVIDVEAPERPDRERPNRQVRAIGDATVTPDSDGVWTMRIWAKYRHDELDAATIAKRLRGRQRVLISLRPHHLVAVASI
jgi:nitroimidazol reductase NimA-like FMN-containing flavoprotein (pyridoxamine 5'-phosphate oxidase superfamily)